MIIDVHALRDPRRPLPVDTRPLAAAVQGLDLDTLDGESRGELGRIVAAVQRALLSPALGPKPWRRSGASRVCPRVVAGLRCQAWTGRGPLERRECICQRYGGNGILDHARLWRTPEGETVLTGEPYHLDPEAFVAFVAECTELGLKVWVSGRSSYYPGATVLVEVRRVTPPEPSALPRERTTAAERRAMMSRRVCFVCRETIPESGAVLHSYAHVMACVGECSSVMESHARDYTRSRRGRLRSAGEVRRLVDKEMGR